MIMKVYENTIAQFRKDVRAKRLVNFLCAEYEASAGKAVTGELRYAWKYAVAILYAMLGRSGPFCDPASGIRIDLEENAGVSHMKLIFASSAENAFRYSLLGIYAGSGVKLTKAEDIVSFREGNKRWTTIHPSLLMKSYSRRLFRGMAEELNEDQIYLFSAILNNVRRNRKAWYVIEEEAGNGEFIGNVMEKLESEGKNVQMLSGGEQPDGKPDLIIISEEDGGTFEQLDYCKD